MRAISQRHGHSSVSTLGGQAGPFGRVTSYIGGLVSSVVWVPVNRRMVTLALQRWRGGSRIKCGISSLARSDERTDPGRVRGANSHASPLSLSIVQPRRRSVWRLLWRLRVRPTARTRRPDGSGLGRPYVWSHSVTTNSIPSTGIMELTFGAYGIFGDIEGVANCSFEF